jgi:secondary thiamine-phosphate synthase enzyme
VEEIQVKTASRTQFIDITSNVDEVIRKSGIKDGFCTIHVPHTTAAVTINENADPAVPRDILMEVNRVIPFMDGYDHMEGNSAAHIKSSLFGCSCSIIISGGELKLGTWQSVFFCEFDGPRTRKTWIQVTGVPFN